MGKLKVDLDVLRKTISEYDSEINEFEDVRTSIKKALEDLRSSGWDTSAGHKWYATLDDDWVRAFAAQIEVIREMQNELSYARTKYDELYNELQTFCSKF